MTGYRMLGPDDLAWRLDEAALGFGTTTEVEDLHEIVGQDRALRALDFGLGIKNFGYNIYVMGQPGTGKMSTVKKVVNEKAKTRPAPSDWLYLMNFKNPDRPAIVELPRGKGKELRDDLDALVEQLKKAIPKAFEGEEFEKRRQEVFSGHNTETSALFDALNKDAHEKGFSLERSPRGLVLVPLKEDGSLMTQEEFEKQDAENKARIEEVGNGLQTKLSDMMRTVRDLEKGFQERLKDLGREFGVSAAGHFIDDLREKYGEHEKLRDYFDEVKEDVLEHLDDFQAQGQQAPAMPFMPQQAPSFDRYMANLLVDNSATEGAPVVYEPNATYPNLFGRVEQKMQYGMATTDFMQIKPGALHRANGGYLVVNVLDLLRNPFAYEGLKRAVNNKKVAVEDAMEQYRMVPLHTLKPQPLPMDVKIVLVGTPYIYYLLFHQDDEYRKLFKVHVDFDSRMDRTEAAVKEYSRFIASHCREEGLPPFTASGVARVIEYSARQVSDKEKLTSRFIDIADIVRESAYWAEQAGADKVGREHVEKAVEEKVYRSSMFEEKIRQAISEGIIKVDITGAVAGQVNGLSVMGIGDYAFGRPSRITARTFMGRAGMVNIEREVKMSGPIHDKGVMILTGFLGDRYAQDKPLSLSASIAFEQSYDGVEGDSASSTELYALLSSLSGAPINQAIAVTGSVNQRGEVQAIGGVNEKVEGYFEVCKALGMTGEQGVMIPESNVRHLMLKDEVVDAVRDGKFRLWAINTIDGGIEVLTGIPAGERQGDGSFPEGTVNFLVDERLKAIGKGLKETLHPQPPLPQGEGDIKEGQARGPAPT